MALPSQKMAQALLIGERAVLKGFEFYIPAASLLAIALGFADARYSVANNYGPAAS